jgi:ABC-type multidrug transport system fused ATPase/permease subunit
MQTDIHITKLLNNNLNKEIYSKFKKIDYSCFEDDNSVNVIFRICDNPCDKMKEVFVSCINTINSMIVLAGVAIIFSQISYLFSILLIPVLSGVIYFSTKGMNILNFSIRRQSTNERLMNYYNSLLIDKHAIVELKIFNAINYILSYRKKKESVVVKELFKKSIQADLVYNTSTILIIIWIVITLIYSSTQIMNDVITLGVFIAVIQASIKIIGIIETASQNISDTVKSLDIVRYYYKFLDLPEMLTKDIKYTGNNPIISFKNVFFKYPNSDKYILKNVSFDIFDKEKVAIVGKNGAGKSTLIKLLFSLYEIESGSIIVNKLISPVFQDFMCYNLTLRENVAIGDIKYLNNDSKINKAILTGQIEDIISSENGLDLNLGKIYDDGIDLSGGQWQRIAVSRAIFPETFLIMDEPTASMDPIQESKMFEYFLNALNNKGCLIISHRLASAKYADKILVLDKEGIVETGNHNELMGRKGLYYNMFTAQASWYNNK